MTNISMECYHKGLSGELAQLVERCDRTAEVRDSSSLFSIESAGGRILARRSGFDSPESVEGAGNRRETVQGKIHEVDWALLWKNAFTNSILSVFNQSKVEPGYVFWALRRVARNQRIVLGRYFGGVNLSI